jgi:hypothetical protein
MRLRWERRKKVDAGQIAEEDDTFLGFNNVSTCMERLCWRTVTGRVKRDMATVTRPAFPCQHPKTNGYRGTMEYQSKIFLAAIQSPWTLELEAEISI